jgi:hypothetical protein
MMASDMGGFGGVGFGGVSARSALTALMVRRGAEGAVNTARNLPPHHLHIYMQGAERSAGVFIQGAEIDLMGMRRGHGHG